MVDAGDSADDPADVLVTVGGGVGAADEAPPAAAQSVLAPQSSRRRCSRNPKSVRTTDDPVRPATSIVSGKSRGEVLVTRRTAEIVES